MEREFLSNHTKHVIIGLILIFFAISAGIRLLPMPTVVHAWGVAMYENDPWYTLRQIEIMVANYPGYTWFDPMTAYPSGKIVDWGPLFPFIAATACLICGAATRAEIMMVASWIPPLLAALLVPAMYLIGKSIADWKTGLLAAALVAIVPGQLFYKSLFGYVDHHVAEAFFSTLFCLGYITTLRYSQRFPVDFRRIETLRTPALLAGATGALYLFGLFTMPTMILFGLLVMVYTPLQGLMDAASSRSSDYLVLLNGIAFGIGIVGLLAFGIQHSGLSLSQYSLGHVIAYILLILGTVAVALLARYFQGRAIHYILALAGIGVAGAGITALAAPAVFEAFAAGSGAFFSSSTEVLTIVEARPWTIGQAWFSFQTGLILMAGGFGLLAVQVYRERRAEGLFVIVWSLLILLATWSHWRYEYYLSVNVALLSAVLVGGVAAHCWGDLKSLVSRGEEGAARNAAKKERKEKHRKEHAGRKADPLKALAMSGAIVLLVLFCAHAIQYDYQSATHAHTTSIGEPWYETLAWVQTHTPDPGVQYLGIYDRDAFRYPEESYGILSWWDYGHWITFLARRMPNTNPFQDNAAGPAGVAGFLMAESEDRAEEQLHRLGSKYVITDTSMANPLRFATIAAWYDSSAGMSPYVQEFLVQDPSGTYRATSLGTERYYATMVARLQNFDGSMAEPADALYVEYGMAADPNRPVLVRSASMPLQEAAEAARRYNDHAAAGYHAAVRSNSFTKPLSTVPALTHFRLVHESASDEGSAVKVFEYVPGARVAGEGVVELNLTTPTGRTFAYRQQSRNGEFVLPYSTLDNPYDVKADGRYRVVGTDREFDVTEEQVRRGEAAG